MFEIKEVVPEMSMWDTHQASHSTITTAVTACRSESSQEFKNDYTTAG
jgi:hypothetical protein